MDSVINLDHGDPTIYEEFWKEKGEAALLKIEAWENMSYFADRKSLCWFLHPKFEMEIRRIHGLVGNAEAAGNRHIVVGNGSSQLYQAALFALATQPGLPETCYPIPVVSAAPYYSGYPAATDFLKSALYKWAGDANAFSPHASNATFIEIICSPNNPDGRLNTAIHRQNSAFNIHDLAYYWPQHTPITSIASHDIMLFTLSKCTGHAGSRLGWALVRDEGVARRMVKFMEVGSIGVAKEAQRRGAAVLGAVCDAYERGGVCRVFEFGREVMKERWRRMRGVVQGKGVFRMVEYPEPAFCGFTKEKTEHLPAFAWLKYEGDEDIEDVASFLKDKHKILTRSGTYCGTDGKFVRISLLEREETFNIFIQRMTSSIF